MKRLLSVSVVLLLLAVPAELFAKGATSKIIIKGTGLRTPIEITDPKMLANFIVWTGPGTDCTGACSVPRTEGFIVDWSQPMAERPVGLQRFEVSFYAKMPDDRDEALVYVVFYEYDPATEHGYVYFPGKGEEWYRLNVGSILRGVEGEWFRAWTAWEGVARPLIARTRAEAPVK